MPADAPAELLPPASVDAPLAGELLDRAAGYAAAARAASTRAAYAADWSHFRSWTAEHGRDPLPASPETVAAYLTAFAGVLSVATLSRRRTTVGLAHRAAQLPDPTAEPTVQEVWAGIRRTHRVAPAAKQALWTADVARLVTALPTAGDTAELVEPGALLGLRDRALLLLGFAAALRRSELAALDVTDVTEDPHGLVVRVRTSKTDQAGAGATVGVPFAQQSTLCPVAAVQAWRAALAEALGVGQSTLTGPLFRPITRHGHIGVQGRAGTEARLSPAAVRLVVRRRCAAVGLDPDVYAAHSLRSGFATQASANGAAERDVMRHGRWRSVAVARGYVQRGSLFTDNAAGRLGL